MSSNGINMVRFCHVGMVCKSVWLRRINSLSGKVPVPFLARLYRFTHTTPASALVK